MGLGLTPDGRPILTGSSCLPPMYPRTEAKANGKNKTTAATDSKRKSEGRFQTLNEFVDTTMAELSRSQVVVWLTLFRDTKDGTVRIDQRNIAKRVGTSVRHVNEAIKKLKSLGLIVVVYQGGFNKGPSRYRVRSAIRQS